MFRHGAGLEVKRDAMHNTVAYRFTETPPYLTVEFDKISILETLIKNGADINARTKTTETALHKVAMFDNEEAIEVLVKVVPRLI